MRRVFVAVLVLAIVTLYLSAARAESGCDPISPTGPFPIPIASNGCWILENDMTVSVPLVLQITAPNVEIDLNGFTILNALGGAKTFVNYNPGSTGSLRIFDGSLVDDNGPGSVGIATGPTAALQTVVIGNTFISSAAAVNATVYSVEIRDSIFLGSVTAAGPGFKALKSQIGSLSVTNATGCVVEDNQIIGAPVDAIVLNMSTDCTIRNNTVTGAGQHGIHLNMTVDTVVTGNNASTNLSSGIALLNFSRFNRIEGNMVNSNASAGLWFDGGSWVNTYGKNVGRQNGASPGTCANSIVGPTCAAPEVCDDGFGNFSFGDNMLPGNAPVGGGPC